MTNVRSILLSVAALLMGAALANAQGFKVNDLEYFENHGANVMVFSDVYPEGHQGGLTIVMNGDRVAGSGDVRLEISQGQWQGLPRMRSRQVNKEGNEISVTLSYPDSTHHLSGFNPAIYPDVTFNYTVNVKGDGDAVVVTVDLNRPVPEWLAGKIGFNLELTPSTLLGQPWIMDERTGYFPHQPWTPAGSTIRTRSVKPV